MDFESTYEISRTAEFIRDGNFTKVALQFPDELLKDSVRVATPLRAELRRLGGDSDAAAGRDGNVKETSLFVMADTAYGSCCVDEVGASHVGADCVVHYGHTCLSPTSKLPAFFAFGKAPLSLSDCAKNLLDHAVTSRKHVLMNPSEKQSISEQGMVPAGFSTDDKSVEKLAGNRYGIGGLVWKLREGRKMENYLLFWIGSDNSAFVNVLLTFNGCELVRYDSAQYSMVTDVSHQKRILKRRYSLVEKAKDANSVGILVGTLGVAGCLHMINQMNELITAAGKKAYTLVMGGPNPAKLANFPECDIFIYASCAQTALLDSKEYLSPVITPFETVLAFNRDSLWTGAFVMEFRDLINSSLMESRSHSKEARFSFLQGSYVEDFDTQENDEQEEEGALALANVTEKALQVRDNANSLVKRTVKSDAEYLATRSYQGLEIHNENSLPEPYLIGRIGRAVGYRGEKSEKENFDESSKV